jgi:hypothetical protein
MDHEIGMEASVSFGIYILPWAVAAAAKEIKPRGSLKVMELNKLKN